MGGWEVGGIVGAVYIFSRLLERTMDHLMEKRKRNCNPIGKITDVDHNILLELRSIREGIGRMESAIGKLLGRIASRDTRRIDRDGMDK